MLTFLLRTNSSFW